MAESRSSSMVKIENDISIRSWAGLEQDLERDREHTGGPGATRGKRGAALWGLGSNDGTRRWEVSTRRMFAQCAKTHFLNYSKTRSQFIQATVEVARRLSYSSTQRLDSPTLAQSTLRGFPDQRNEHTCDEIIYDRQQGHYQEIQRARTAVRNRTGVQGVRPRVDDDIVSFSQEYIKLAA